MPVNRGRVPTVNCFEKGFSKQMRISKGGAQNSSQRSKKSRAAYFAVITPLDAFSQKQRRML
jgi:hypothetical protein